MSGRPYVHEQRNCSDPTSVNRWGWHPTSVNNTQKTNELTDDEPRDRTESRGIFAVSSGSAEQLRKINMPDLICFRFCESGS